MAIHSGGYDCEFVETPPKVVQSECPVCLQIIQEPYQADCCGYAFCQECIKRIKANSKRCPCCMAEQFNTFEDKRLKRTLYAFKVYCTNKRQGCQWEGELRQLDDHLNSTPSREKQQEGCQFTLIKCIYGSGLFQRSDIQVHQDLHCPKRPYSCKYCKVYDSTFEDITTNHWYECGYHPVQCVNRCGKIIERQQLHTHISKYCPLAVLDCEFSHVGCKVKLPRKDMEAHLVDNVVKHMSLQAVNYKEVIDRLQRENKELKEEVERLTQDLQQICIPICPPVFTMDKFKQRKRDNEVWYSTPFYTHHKGYKMCVGIQANSYSERKGTYTSVSIHLMKGEFDDELKWPFRGQITIRLLSQVDMDYKEFTYSFTETQSDYNAISCRPLTQEIGQVLCDFVSHTELQPLYLKHDCLKLSVHQYVRL